VAGRSAAKGASGRLGVGDTGEGDTDCMLFALHSAAASLTGPMTRALVGMVPAGTGGRGLLSRTWDRLCVRVAGGQTLQPERGLDEGQGRGVFERAAAEDLRPSEIGDDDGRYPEAELRVVGISWPSVGVELSP
jgi:hypothetical protein